MDRVTPKTRSWIMSRIRSHGNKTTELALMRVLKSSSLHGWRRASNLPGKPDFVYPVSKVAIFVDGCFWHGCPRCAKYPATRSAYWRRRFEINRARDRRATGRLRREGWKVIRIWEHEISQQNLARKLHLLSRFLRDKRSVPNTLT
jgi:DNA mismatch endonuclease (patch repair protein)